MTMMRGGGARMLRREVRVRVNTENGPFTDKITFREIKTQDTQHNNIFGASQKFHVAERLSTRSRSSKAQ